MLMGLEDKGKSEGNTLFYWIPDTPVVPPSAGTTGVPRMTAGGGTLPGLFWARQLRVLYLILTRPQGVP